MNQYLINKAGLRNIIKSAMFQGIALNSDMSTFSASIIIEAEMMNEEMNNALSLQTIANLITEYGAWYEFEIGDVFQLMVHNELAEDVLKIAKVFEH